MHDAAPAMPDEEGERLAGGNVGGAWRVGDTVRRATGPWTPAVHRLLEYLRPRVPHVPEVLGFDERGREVLTYLPGRVVDIDTEVLTEAQLSSLVRWTRTFHQAVAGLAPDGPWRFFPVENPTLIGHNDIASYNVCFDGDDLVGVFDWDFAGPSTPLMEIAFVAWNGVPLWRSMDEWLAAHRLRLIAADYGTFTPAEILAAVPGRIQLLLNGIPVGAAAGDQGLVNLMAEGEPERSQRSLDGLVRRIPGISRHLD